MERLRAGTIPMVCVKTGVPTTTVRTETLVYRHRASWKWYLLLGPAAFTVASLLGSQVARVALPIAPEVARRYRTWRALGHAARVAGLLAILAAQSWLVTIAVLGALYGLNHYVGGVWCRPEWTGGSLRVDAHPNFRDALREPPRPLLPQLLPAGWYADPAGQHTYRWWTGYDWTEQVA